MQTYPYSSPIILTESIFVANGGQTGTFTSAQLQAAFLDAEMRATQYLGTFLLPTIVTGTFPYSDKNGFVATDYGYVHQILAVNILGKVPGTSCTLQSDASCAFIFNDTFGYLDVKNIFKCGCNAVLVSPYQYQITYQSGLPTGTATKPGVLLGLTMSAQIFLNEIAYPSANESAGDVGVMEFSNQGYSEKRKPLKRTAFGNSAKANFIAHLMDVVPKARKALYL